MVKMIRIDPGKKPPFKPEQVAIGDDPRIHSSRYLERLLLEREKDPDTLLPEGMTVESLRKLVALERKKEGATMEASVGSAPQPTEPQEYAPPSDEQLQSMGLESGRVKKLVDKWRGRRD